MKKYEVGAIRFFNKKSRSHYVVKKCTVIGCDTKSVSIIEEGKNETIKIRKGALSLYKDKAQDKCDELNKIEAKQCVSCRAGKTSVMKAEDLLSNKKRYYACYNKRKKRYEVESCWLVGYNGEGMVRIVTSHKLERHIRLDILKSDKSIIEQRCKIYNFLKK